MVARERPEVHTISSRLPEKTTRSTKTRSGSLIIEARRKPSPSKVRLHKTLAVFQAARQRKEDKECRSYSVN